jgi:hypothetical protein
MSKPKPPKATKSSRPSIREDADIGVAEIVFTSPQSRTTVMEVVRGGKNAVAR